MSHQKMEIKRLRFKEEGNVMLYATPNPFLLNKICLNQEKNMFHNIEIQGEKYWYGENMRCGGCKDCEKRIFLL